VAQQLLIQLHIDAQWRSSREMRVIYSLALRMALASVPAYGCAFLYSRSYLVALSYMRPKYAFKSSLPSKSHVSL
jgi:hypothetical protein